MIDDLLRAVSFLAQGAKRAALHRNLAYVSGNSVQEQEAVFIVQLPSPELQAVF